MPSAFGVYVPRGKRRGMALPARRADSSGDVHASCAATVRLPAGQRLALVHAYMMECLCVCALCLHDAQPQVDMHAPNTQPPLSRYAPNTHACTHDARPSTHLTCRSSCAVRAFSNISSRSKRWHSSSRPAVVLALAPLLPPPPSGAVVLPCLFLLML